jgi:hypothetical protein
MPFIAQSMASMAQTFIKNILSHSSVAPLVEANNLLSLMRYTALKMRYIINHHPALVLGDNQSDYYIRMHIYIWEVMWAINQDGYVFLSQNLELPQDWLTRLRWKTHMAGFYVGSIYHPNGLVDANETIVKEVGEGVIRYKHNGTCEIEWLACLYGSRRKVNIQQVTCGTSHNQGRHNSSME